jgi:C-terminal processing protease CtpA/Prc
MQRAQQAAAAEEDQENLAGVGIVFIKAPDNSLFVKSIIDGSGACGSGIQPGDCLMKARAAIIFRACKVIHLEHIVGD